MSDLQLGLIAIGALVVVAVLGYNKWQELKFRRQAERGIKSRHDDVLMGEDAVGRPAGTQSAPARAGRIEPTFDAQSANAGGASEAPVAGLSEALDFIVAIEAADAADGEAMIDASVAALSGFSKPMRVEGYREGRWEALQHGGRYALMRAGLQLADRRGAVGAEELATFGAAAQEAAAAAGALATVPDRGEALKRAADLDRFCSEVDIQISLHVLSASTPFPGTKVRALAEAAGFVLEDDGRFRRRDEQGRVMCQIGNMDRTPWRADTMRATSTNGLTLELDVPRTPGPARAFEQFRDLARHLAQALEGSIVDDNRAALSVVAFDQILAQVQAVQRAMEARGVTPGSASALRLFS